MDHDEIVHAKELFVQLGQSERQPEPAQFAEWWLLLLLQLLELAVSCGCWFFLACHMAVFECIATNQPSRD